MSRTTYPEAKFDFVDVTAQEDSTVSSQDAASFSDSALFYGGPVHQASYGTLEHNRFILDGTEEIFPADGPKDIPFWSTNRSGGDCLYADPPMLVISFSKPHSSIGLTLSFAAEIPSEIRVTWYTLHGTKLIAETYHPKDRDCFCECGAKNYGKITVEFLKSSLPDRYARLDHVEYGRTWLFGRETIKSASVYEELDPTSATVSINTAQLEIIDAAGDFELANRAGLWQYLQKEQRMTVTEYINGCPVDCGTFYLQSWSSQENIVRLSLVDVIGIMDKTTFYEGAVYDGVEAGTILDAVMASCGLKNYQVEETVRKIKLSGWLGIQSHRAALQQIVFACGAVADCSRTDGVRIYSPDRYVSHTIGTNRKFLGSQITLEEYVSSVTVSYSRYVPEEESTKISEDALPVGVSRIEFSEPYVPESVTVSGGSIVEASTNYVTVRLEAAGAPVIEGKKYKTIENACTESLQEQDAGEGQNVKQYKGCTLLGEGRAREAAKQLLDYHRFRQTVTQRYINEGETVGDWCRINQPGGGYAVTRIINQTLDLTGGNIASMSGCGYSSETTAYYFAGNELYAGEEVSEDGFAASQSVL
ncbi:MAG: hypothetical protein NC541_15995 [bacterium]|nr:hypothetical protein [bacterium]